MKRVLKRTLLILFVASWIAALLWLAYFLWGQNLVDDYKESHDNYFIMKIPETDKLVMVCHSQRLFWGSVKLYELTDRYEQVYIGKLHNMYKESADSMDYKIENNGDGTFSITCKDVVKIYKFAIPD